MTKAMTTALMILGAVTFATHALAQSNTGGQGTSPNGTTPAANAATTNTKSNSTSDKPKEPKKQPSPVSAPPVVKDRNSY